MAGTASVLKAKICPSLLSADFAILASESQRMVACGADYLHVDVMDGHFVPNLTLGAPVVKSLRKHTTAFLDCHLMVEHPAKWVDDFAAAGADGFTFHVEVMKSGSEFDELVSHIKTRKMRAGVAISPDTPTSILLKFLERPAIAPSSSMSTVVDMVLVMTVRPGFGGQSFMLDQLEKVREIRARYPHIDIQVDGGLTCDTVRAAADAGANVIVSGSGIFNASIDPQSAIAQMRATVDAALASNTIQQQQQQQQQ